MVSANHKIDGFTTEEAAAMVGVSESRIRQLVATGEIESDLFLGRRIITEEGIRQAQARNKALGRKPKDAASPNLA